MLFTLLTSAALAAASPLAARQWTGYPPIKSAPGVILVANITDLTKNIFGPPVNHWYLSTERIGAGRNAAVLTPNITEATLLFVNGTAQDRSRTSTSIMAPPLDTNQGPIPMGLQFPRSRYGDVNVALPGVNFGLGDQGAKIGVRDPYARLAPPQGPTNFGSFVVCNEESPVYGRPQYSVLWVEYQDYYTGEERPAPENCVRMELLAQCAELPPLVGEKELEIVNIGSLCYTDVNGIDWNAEYP